MPAILAQALRPLAIAIISGVSVSAVENALTSFYDRFVADTKKEYGVTDTDAQALVQNVLIDALLYSAVLFALVKGRIPVRVADRLGLSAKGYTKRMVSTEATAKVSQRSAQDPKGLTIGRTMLLSFVASFAGSIPWLPSIVQNVLDQGTFNPVAANAAMAAIGLPDFLRWPIPGGGLAPATYTASEFTELFNQLSTAGAIGINATYAQQTQTWSKDNLSALINYIVGELVLVGKRSDKTAIKAELTKYLITKQTGTPATPVSTTPGGFTIPSGGGTVPREIKVFTGIVGGGTLGAPAEFVARPDDMIQDVGELKTAAKNNLASFVQSIPGKFYYEIGIVNSVKTKSGFTQKGEAVRVVSGYTTTGKPRYKTVYHKFAVMKLGVYDENGRQIKLGTINLGPVNVVDFQPSAVELREVEQSITPELFTSDINEIQQIVTQQQVNVTTTPPPAPVPAVANTLPVGAVSLKLPTGIFYDSNDFYKTTVYYQNPTSKVYSEFNLGNIARQFYGDAVFDKENGLGGKYNFSGGQQAMGRDALTALGIDISKIPSLGFADAGLMRREGKLVAGTVDQLRSILSATKATGAGSSATSLTEWYTARGEVLPPLSVRAAEYQVLDLGPTSTYVGTAEQNNRLLMELKRNAGFL